MRYRISITNLPYEEDYTAIGDDIKGSFIVSNLSCSIPKFSDGRQKGYMTLEFDCPSNDEVERIVSYLNTCRLAGKAMQASLTPSFNLRRSEDHRSSRDTSNFQYFDEPGRRRDAYDHFDPSYSLTNREMAYPYSFGYDFRMNFIRKHQTPQEVLNHTVQCSNPHCPKGGTISESDVHLDHNPSLAERFTKGEHRITQAQRRSSFFDESRLQILCSTCNERKSGEGYQYKAEHLKNMRY
ncbi:MAG: hypothetical protein ACQ5SW_09695 [Sphaerochaetaceae bacterium]